MTRTLAEYNSLSITEQRDDLGAKSAALDDILEDVIDKIDELMFPLDMDSDLHHGLDDIMADLSAARSRYLTLADS
jgi:hypothetical protein